MIDLTKMAQQSLNTEPYGWVAVGDLFSPEEAEALGASFPCDHFKTVSGYGGEKDYEYEARPLIAMGANLISYSEELSDEWLHLAQDFLSPAYRAALSLLTNSDLTAALLEVNVFHYGPGALLGPHPDLPDKLVTHVMYFNRTWNSKDGGCLNILRSGNPNDVAAEIEPIVGNSAVLVRSENSWHAVSPVVKGCTRSRRSLTATFYRPGSISTMWPPDDTTPLRNYDGSEFDNESAPASLWKRYRRRFAEWKNS